MTADTAIIYTLLMLHVLTNSFFSSKHAKRSPHKGIGGTQEVWAPVKREGSAMDTLQEDFQTHTHIPIQSLDLQ